MDKLPTQFGMHGLPLYIGHYIIQSTVAEQFGIGLLLTTRRKLQQLCVIMAARQLAGRRPLYFTADVSILLLYFFFRRLISGVSGPIVTKLRHMFDGDCNF